MFANYTRTLKTGYCPAPPDFSETHNSVLGVWKIISVCWMYMQLKNKLNGRPLENKPLTMLSVYLMSHTCDISVVPMPMIHIFYPVMNTNLVMNTIFTNNWLEIAKLIIYLLPKSSIYMCRRRGASRSTAFVTQLPERSIIKHLLTDVENRAGEEGITCF